MKILGKEIINSSKYLNFIASRFLNKNNEEGIWYWAERTNNGKTVVIAAIMDGKLVVTKEFRVPIADYEWSMPAGLVENEDSVIETAKRELKEETNLEIIDIQEVTPYLYNTAGMTNEKVSIVFCTANGLIHNEGNEITEDIETFLMDITQVQELMKDGNLKISAKAYLIFDRFVRNGKW